MAKLVRSAKGQIIDWNQLKIKNKLSEKPITVDVEARKKFIDEKLHRRLDKIKNKTKTNLVDKEVSKIDAVAPDVVEAELLKIEAELLDSEFEPVSDDVDTTLNSTTDDETIKIKRKK